MATAHGAGLMVVPLLVVSVASTGNAASPAAHSMHGVHAAHAMLMPMSALTDVTLWATVFHTGGYLFVTGVVAVVVYHKLGLRLLRAMWINLDLVWGGALIITGALTPLF